MSARGELIKVLTPLGFEEGNTIFLQGTLGDREYPKEFFTFFNDDSEDLYIDDKIYQTLYYFTLNFYSVDPERVENMMEEIKPLLKQNSFIVEGKGYDAYSDEPSHTGRSINIIYVKNYNN